MACSAWAYLPAHAVVLDDRPDALLPLAQPLLKSTKKRTATYPCQPSNLEPYGGGPAGQNVTKSMGCNGSFSAVQPVSSLPEQLASNQIRKPTYTGSVPPASQKAADLGSGWEVQWVREVPKLVVQPAVNPTVERLLDQTLSTQSEYTQTLFAQTDPDPTKPVRSPIDSIERLQDPPRNPNPSTTPIDPSSPAPSNQRVQCLEFDQELGCVRIRPEPIPGPRQPIVYLIPRIDYFRSSNIFAATIPIRDDLFRPGLTLFATPPLGPSTYVVASVSGNLAYYTNQTDFNYNELGFRAGVFQVLSPTMFGEFGWSNQRLFIATDDLPGFSRGTRFFDDHVIRFELSRRDRLSPKLTLNTLYQFRASFANPEDRSRIGNTVFVSLNYDLQPTIQVGVDYQFAATDFTRQNRDDRFHQFTARLTYTMFRNTQATLFAGYSFGSSTEPGVDFNSTIFGVSLSVSLGLF